MIWILVDVVMGLVFAGILCALALGIRWVWSRLTKKKPINYSAMFKNTIPCGVCGYSETYHYAYNVEPPMHKYKKEKAK